MAEIASGAVVLANGNDLSCYFKTISVEAERETKESTVLCNDARQYVPSLASRTVSGEGFWSNTPAVSGGASLDELFTTLHGSAQMIFSLGQGGAASGSNAVMMYTHQSEFKCDDITPGELKMMQFAAQASGTANNEWQRGVFLYTPTAVTSATSGTSYDTTSGGTGWIANIHVVDGDGNATVQIEHSANDSTWADLSSAAYAPFAGYQVSDTDDSVNRYVRVTVTPVGTTSTVAVSFKLGYTG